VIFALTHPYATGTILFADGAVAEEQPEAPGSAARDAAIATWSLDQRFVLSQLERLAAHGSGHRMAGRLALDRVGILGHSRGGAAAALSCRDDARFVACANLDGSVSSPLASSAPTQPFLLLRSELPEATLGDFFERLPGPAYRVDVAGAGHNDFSDLPQLAAELAARGTLLDPVGLLLGTLAPERSRGINTAVLDAFFAQQLRGQATTLFSAPPFAELTIQSRRP
jgi:predicted dienelactone hydrolase